MACGRCHRMDNRSGVTIEVANVAVHSRAGWCHSVIILQPGSHCFYPASIFTCDRPSAVYVYVNGVRQASRLQPHCFKRFIRISFYVDGDGRLTVKGVEPNFTDYLRFWRRLVRQDYVGRREVIIIQPPRLHLSPTPEQ